MSGLVFDQHAADKAARMLEFLETLRSHPAIADRVCIHGGTALNLFVLTPERLSLDADINYVGACGPKEIPSISQTVESAVESVARELGYIPRAGKIGHAGRTFKLIFNSAITGSTDFLKVDLDYMNRVPILPPIMAQSKLDDIAVEFPINAPAEVAAGKLKAICECVVPRDLYDIGRVAKTEHEWSTGDSAKDHALMIFYYALSSSFPKQQDILARFDGRERDIETILWPVLPVESKPTLEGLKRNASPFLAWATTPINDDEADFLTSLSIGDYRPDLLFASDPDSLKNAISSPAMQWKLKNLRAGIE